PHMSAYVRSLLSAMSFEVKPDEQRPADAVLWVRDATPSADEEVRRFLSRNGGARRVVLFGAGPGRAAMDGVIEIDADARPARVREAIHEAAAACAAAPVSP